MKHFVMLWNLFFPLTILVSFYFPFFGSPWFLAPNQESPWGALTSNQKLHKSIFDQKSSSGKANKTVRRLVWSPIRQTILMEQSNFHVVCASASRPLSPGKWWWPRKNTLYNHITMITTAAAAQSISQPRLGQLIKIKFLEIGFCSQRHWLMDTTRHDSKRVIREKNWWWNWIFWRIFITTNMLCNLITRDSFTPRFSPSNTTQHNPIFVWFFRLTYDQLSRKSARLLSACETITAMFMGQEVVGALTRQRHRQHHHTS